jgi:Domain of unknown function (DUF2431)
MLPRCLPPHLRSYLFLGEGDFSFTHALSRLLSDPVTGKLRPGYTVLATSYDSEQEVISRYKKQVNSFSVILVFAATAQLQAVMPVAKSVHTFTSEAQN